MSQNPPQKPQAVIRAIEIIFPLTTWVIITLPVWLSPFHPAVVAYFILTFDIYFFYKSLSVAIFSTLSFLKLTRLSKIDWLVYSKKLPDFKKIHHVVIIPNYKESLEKVKITLQHIKDQDFPKKRIFVILAMEEREGTEAKLRAEALIKEFNQTFGFIGATYHPDLPGEIKGKASNSTWAAKFLTKLVRQKGLDPSFVTITSCDADSLLPAKYFSYLTHKFLTDSDRYYNFYWAPVLLYSNFWEVPLPIRLQATISSIVRLSLLSRPETLIHVSTYSLSLHMLEKVGYWDTDIIPEDWHIFLQAFFTLGEKVKTLPIYLTVSRDAVNNSTYIGALRSRYEQEKRWAWGITDVPYAIHKFFTTKNIPFLSKFFRVFFVAESHLFWPTSFFILTLAASIPAIINPAFSRTTLGYNLPKLSGLILTITTFFLIILIIIDMKSRPKRPASYSIAKTPLLIFQWFLLPVVTFFLSSLPALEAHTRLLLGKRLEYKVTEKV
ncbi:glycosyltransferase family 2 protein [Candidatus Gottesmanbacteria bacterium]|nr:glycosyltransferase family 2 protein [Candidatus Gottesmanbacteria bacterium]